MRKCIFVIAAIVALSSCSVIKPHERVSHSYFSDYRPYAEEGFLISPSPYTYAFESVGEIDIYVKPALQEVGVASIWGHSSYNSGNNKGLDYEEIPYDELVAMAVKEAKAKGADALVNFSIIAKDITTIIPNQSSPATGYEYHIKGYCIKRK